MCEGRVGRAARPHDGLRVVAAVPAESVSLRQGLRCGIIVGP